MNTSPLKKRGQELAGLDGNCTNQDRLSSLVSISNFFHHRVELGAPGAIDVVWPVVADHRDIGRNDHHVQPIDLAGTLPSPSQPYRSCRPAWHTCGSSSGR